MRKITIKFLFLIDRLLRFLKIPRGTFLWKVNGVLLRNLKQTFVHIHGFDMFLDRRDSLGLSLTEFEPETVKIFKEFIKPGDVVLDIGANIGYFTLLASKLGAKVIAFEPESESFKLLKKNVEHNNFNARIHNKAVSDKYDKVKLFLNPDNLAGHSLIDMDKKGGTVEVETVPLDQYLTDRKVDFIKMDIEGNEYKALLGMDEILDHNPDLKMIVEYCSDSQYGHKMIEFLNKKGFRFYERIGDEFKLIYPLELISGKYKTNLFCHRTGKGNH